MRLSLQGRTVLQLGLDPVHVTHPGNHFLKPFSLQWRERAVLTTFLFAFVRDCFQDAGNLPALASFPAEHGAENGVHQQSARVELPFVRFPFCGQLVTGAERLHGWLRPDSGQI